ncbi:carboxylesterase/lipase family protein [Arachidicoccus ginsenosidimutans]|uniref:carboxylesterase/lipase family protein n=1 Tax=Arachidicoccus sp. BS20 TaxID=1850526 RepID=UPI000AD9150A|nr:carboxylesterase family protein [Arachidicoccus sp. BS20]
MFITKIIGRNIVYCLSVFCMASAAKAQSEIVHIRNGYIEGLKEENSYVFKGVPYAKTPVGEFRFKAPQPTTNWIDTLDCTKFSPVAPQASHPVDEENFLSLNIYSNDLKSSKACPVMVWIHGGGMTGGTGKDFNGHAFSDRDSIVAVTFNYRLGAFGFLELNDLGKDYATSGNNAVLDCITALKWIKNNIGKFGGDPDKITVMGESAGAKLVAALLATPLSDGLIHQAVMESGGVQCIHDSATAFAIRKRLFEALNITNPKDILSISTEKIIRAQEKVLSGAQGTNYFGPVIDGIVYKENPYKYILHHRRKIRILIGTNKSEAKLFMDFDKRLYHPTEKVLTDWFGANGSVVYCAFKKAIAGVADTASVAVPLLTQYMYQMHSYRLAKAFSEANYPTWVYRFDYGKGKYGAVHGDELKYVWYIPNAVHNKNINDSLAEEIHSDWVNFIKGKNVDNSWIRYNAAHPEIKVYDNKAGIQRLSSVYDDIVFPSSVFVLKP